MTLLFGCKALAALYRSFVVVVKTIYFAVLLLFAAATAAAASFSSSAATAHVDSRSTVYMRFVIVVFSSVMLLPMYILLAVR